MSYPYYQQNRHLGWGTNQPPSLTCHPIKGGGLDYYRAHSSGADTSLFDHAWNRVRDYSGAAGAGVGLHEARHWHRRAYGGLGELNHMLPVEIGHAAAYEAYRTWIHNSSIYEPLSGDTERQREGLIGLAVAEATRLLQYSTRPADHYARMGASEAAAYTASIIFRQSREDMDGGGYRSRSRSHLDDPYAFDDDLAYPRRPRSRSRSRHRTMSSSYGMQGGGYASSIPIPGGSPVGGYGGHPGSYGGHPGSFGSYSSSSGGGSGVMQNYSHSYRPLPQCQSGSVPSYHGSSVPMVIPAGGRSRSTSFSTYGQPGYGAQPAQYMGNNSVTIIITKPSKSHRKHKHHHHHRHGKRSRSIEPVYARY
ncbi:hypothetical protein BD779DRAFT_1512588 [Infundibulicybe gibba]|nr:hypothetical protein BD779DRAFT_1512588 [Infundibulicybe gibba]